LWMLTLDNVIFTSESILFFSVGSFVGMKNKMLPEKKWNGGKTFLVIWILVLLIKTTVQLYYGSSICTMLLLKISILIGLIAFWIMYDNVAAFIDTPAISKLLPYTFFIFAFHEPVLTIIKKVSFAIFGTGNAVFFAAYVIAPILTIVICLISSAL